MQDIGLYVSLEHLRFKVAKEHKRKQQHSQMVCLGEVGGNGSRQYTFN